MNRYTLSLAIFLLSLVGLTSAHAQQSIAYVDIAAIMKELPEAQEAQRMLDATVDKWQKELREMEDDWQAKFNDYDKRKLILTEQGRARAEKELQELDARIMDYRDQKFGQDGELFKEEDRLMRPIQDLVFNQVEQLAKELGYDYVVDKSGGVMIIYANPENDLTMQTIERVKSFLPARDAPGATTQGGGGIGGGGTGTQPTETRQPTGTPDDMRSGQDGSVPPDADRPQ